MGGNRSVLESFSAATGVGTVALRLSGEIMFSSLQYRETQRRLQPLIEAADCEEACHVALLYSAYQARRFGGQYTFINPAGFVHCAVPLLNAVGSLYAVAAAGPLLMTDPDEYLEIDFPRPALLDAATAEKIREALGCVPVRAPDVVRALSDQLALCAESLSARRQPVAADKPPVLPPSAVYPIDRETQLLEYIRRGNTEQAGAALNDILGQVLFHSGGKMELLRSRVVELTVLLSRAAMQGGAAAADILGMNYQFLNEIDALESPDDLVLWLHDVIRRFVQRVFYYADAKHSVVLQKAVAYMNDHYAERLTLRDTAEQVFLSPPYLSRIFTEETGKSFSAYLKAVRVDAAARLLSDLSVSLADIPAQVGFESQSYFTTVFKREKGVTPGRYRQKTLERAAGEEAENDG